MTRDQIFDALSALTPTQLHTVVYKLAVPRAILPGPSTPPATVIIELLYWAEQQGRLEDVVHVLAEVSAPKPAALALDPVPAPALGQGAADGGIVQARTSTASDAAGAASAGRPRARNGAQPTPVYLNAEVQAQSEQLEQARQRKQRLRNAGIATDEVDREILELRRKLRDGGQLRAGDSLGDDRYLLVKPVGRGGFAVVWEAFDCAEQRRVAIKVLHHHLASDPQRRERFFRGARVMMDLKHPAVVRVLDPRGEDESFCYFVMELVPSGNLREAVLGNRVAAAHRLALILQVGEALAEAHRQQLVHRDIKPLNILLDEQGNAKLTDFDLVGAHDTTGGTRTGALGTVVYAAPECLERPQDATARADVYGLGMTAIFGLVGRELSLSTFRDPEPTIAGLDCSAQVKDVLRRAVAWEPEQRFGDAGEMVAALKNAAKPAEPDERPAWAVDSGRDDYGMWAAFEINGVQQRMRWIPAGQFVMGSPPEEALRTDDERPQHEVTLTRGYWLGETPVTQALWVAVMGENPSRFRGERPEDLERPVEQVSWDDCQRFLEVLNAQVAGGLGARLPTEAEWERACRAGTTTATRVGELSGGVKAPELDAIAWYSRNSGRETHPVGRKAPNLYGLHDMLGNVWEWCADDMREYTAAAVTDPVGDGQGSLRANRGGSWNFFAGFVRAAYRYANSRGLRDATFGFRLAGGQSVLSKYAKLQRENDERVAELELKDVWVVSGSRSGGSGTPSIEKPPGRQISVADRPTGDASSLSADAVLSKIQSAYMAGLKRCYREFLKKDASARGKVKLSLTVNETGRTVKGAAHGFAAEIDECITSQMSTWRFPIPKDKDGEATDASFEIWLQFVPD